MIRNFFAWCGMALLLLTLCLWRDSLYRTRSLVRTSQTRILTLESANGSLRLEITPRTGFASLSSHPAFWTSTVAERLQHMPPAEKIPLPVFRKTTPLSGPHEPLLLVQLPFWMLAVLLALPGFLLLRLLRLHHRRHERRMVVPVR